MDTPQPPFLSKLLAEVKRRRVFRVALVYFVVAWGGVEVAATVLPSLGAPDWTVTLVVVLAVIGFPLAVGLAWAFDITPEGVQRTAASGSERLEAPESGIPPRTRRAGGFVLGFIVALTLGWVAVSQFTVPAEDRALDANAVAVLPFRVAGADAELAFLHEGMVDLLAAKFTGAGGLRAVDPQAVLSAVRTQGGPEGEQPSGAAAMAARAVGAGLVLTGSVVGVPSQVTLSGTLVETASGKTRAQASVEGPADDLSELVDRLAASLMSLSAGEAEQRLSSLTSRSLPALQSYLDGQAAYRKSRFDEAITHFNRAVEQDSTFTLAWFGLQLAASWGGAPELEEARARAWTDRERLSPRDRALLLAYTGRGYPHEPYAVSEVIELAEDAIQHAPDRPDTWYLLGDRYYHFGALIGAPDAAVRARANFERAVELDSTFLLPLVHLVELTAAERDLEALDRFGSMYLAADTGGAYGPVVRWQMVSGAGDPAALRSLRERLPELSTETLALLLGLWRRELLLREDADAIAELLMSRTGTRVERQRALFAVLGHRLLRGQQQSLAALESEANRLMGESWPPEDQLLSILYQDLDPARAPAAVEVLERRWSGFESLDPEEHHSAIWGQCALEQWRLWEGEPGTAAESLRRIRAVAEPADSVPAATRALQRQACTLVLEALLAVTTGATDADEAVRRLDAFLLEGRPIGVYRIHGHMILARLWERAGEAALALAALERQTEALDLGPDPWTRREEGRLAALIGDRERAIRAYEAYLAMRPDPEPPIDAEAAAVRDELQRLLSDHVPDTTPPSLSRTWE